VRNQASRSGPFAEPIGLETHKLRALKIAAPLAMAVALAGVCLYFLWREARNPDATAASSASRVDQALASLQRTKVNPEEIPFGSPTANDPFRWPQTKPERSSGEFPRWNLKDFPEGWSPEIAKKIHDYFEAMDFDGHDREKVLTLAKTRKDLVDFLASLGPDAIPTLQAILNAEGDFVDRRQIIEALGNLGPQSEEATLVLRDFFMARYKDPQNLSEIGHVIDAMGHLKNATSFDTLSNFIQRQDLHRYRDKFLVALGDHPRREEATGTFLDSLLNDQLEQVRNKAAQSLGKVASPETLNDLYNALDRERWFYAKQTILGTIGKIGDPSSLPFLEEKAKGAKESGVRLSAAGAIRRIGTASGQQILREIARTEPDPMTRQHFESWVKEDAGKR
jgi:HEAT repeat protein